MFQNCVDMLRRTSSCDEAEEEEVATACNNLGIACNKLGTLERAAQAHRDALDIRLRLHGPQALETAQSLYNLAQVYVASGDRRTAGPLFDRAGDIYRLQLGAAAGETQDAVKKGNKCRASVN